MLKSHILKFVFRGDPASVDWSQATLTTNGTWQDLNCSSIVPAGAKAVLFRAGISHTAANQPFYMRRKGQANTANICLINNPVANITMGYDLIVPCNESRIVQYQGTNIAYTYLSLTVAGWFF